MRFIVDAQLPKKLSQLLNDLGYDSIHTLDLQNRNATSDKFICELSLKDKRIVLSKDFDFYESYFQKLEPYKLLYVNTGNISTTSLLSLISKNINKIEEELSMNTVVELTHNSLITII